MIDEAELRRLTPDERRQLAYILAAIDRPHPLMDPRLRRRRRFGLLFMTACCVGLACWIAILIQTLPGRYTSSHWQAAWVGLDLAELAGFAATAWAAWHQRQVVIFFMIITGTLLVCDAWFDLALAYGSPGFTMSLVSALVAELPLALLLFNAARRLVRVTIATMMQASGVAGHVPPLWRIPLFADGLEECLPARLRSLPADVTTTAGPSSLGIRGSRGETRGRRRHLTCAGARATTTKRTRPAVSRPPGQRRRRGAKRSKQGRKPSCESSSQGHRSDRPVPGPHPGRGRPRGHRHYALAVQGQPAEECWRDARRR